MQHSAHTGSSRRQDRVPLEVEIDLRGSDLESSLARRTARFDRLGANGELTLDEPHESVLAADGLNVSVGGIAMRAPFVPPLGALLECSFQCPPTGELVRAQGEVMWSERTGPDEGLFGLRFIELDTKSATALRRFVAPNPAPNDGAGAAAEDGRLERTRMVSLSIDGLGAPVEAELKLSDDSRVVLEQQLSFLQLGRGVELSLPDAGGKSRKQRGRIASVELRHTHFDVPTLVFGVLLDEAPERAVQAVPAQVAPLFSALTWPEPAWPEPVTAQVSARLRARDGERERAQQVADDDSFEWPTHEATTRVSKAPEPPNTASVEAGDFMQSRAGLAQKDPSQHRFVVVRDSESDTHPDARLPASAADSAPSLVVEDAEVDEAAYMDAHAAAFDKFASEQLAHHDAQLDDAQLDEPPLDDEPELESEVSQVDRPAAQKGQRDGELALRLRSLPAHLRALFDSSAAQLQGLRRRVEPALREHAEYFDLPDAKTRFLLQLARLRMLLLQSLSKLRRPPRRAGPRAPRALRVQRSTLVGIGPGDNERSELGNVRSRAEPRASTTARTIAIAFAAVGVGLCVYALAPRSSADRIKLPQRAEGLAEASQASPSSAAKVELDLSDDAIEPPAAPKRLTRKAARRAAQLAAVQAANGQAVTGEDPSAAQASLTSAPFGEASVPNGRVFALRMNGPVQVVEGEVRDNGITVRIPGRQAIDRASPIATSHGAVARAMILNRGGYAELTIDFVPGMSPRYQVRGKDDTLEVTLERL